MGQSPSPHYWWQFRVSRGLPQRILDQAFSLRLRQPPAQALRTPPSGTAVAIVTVKTVVSFRM